MTRANAEIRVVNGDRFTLALSVTEAEKCLSDAARSGQARLAWFDLASHGRVGVNHAHVVSLREI